MKPMPSRQRGVILFVGLIMLTLLTVLALSAYNAGKSSLQIVGNMQHRNEAVAAAQEAIEEAVSTTRLYKFPNDILADTCAGPNTRCVDVNGDGTNDVTVTLTATCIAKKATPPSDPLCTASSVDELTGLPRLVNCPDTTLWNIRAEATDAATQAKVVVNEGVAVRVPAGSCP